MMCTEPPWGELLEYRDGFLFWKVSPSIRTKRGDVAGSLRKEGYWYVSYKGSKYRSHRIIWSMFNGTIPAGMQVDHIDVNSTNNLIANLRLATHTENARNRHACITNALGLKGVRKDSSGSTFRAQIGHEGVIISLGSHSTPELAKAAYDAAAKELHGEFFRS